MFRFLIVLALIAQPISVFALSISQDTEIQKKSFINNSLSKEQFVICKLNFDDDSRENLSHCNVCDLFSDDKDVVFNNHTIGLSKIIVFSLRQELIQPYIKYTPLILSRSPPSKLS